MKKKKQKTKLKLPSTWALKILTIIINLGGEGRDQELKAIIGYCWAYVISRPGCTYTKPHLHKPKGRNSVMSTKVICKN